jgi:raffinose/stachyose/melibiose transport system permease protein
MLLIFFPLYLTVVTAFKTTAESSQNFFSFPRHFYLGNFKSVIQSSDYFGYVGNSVLITAVSIVVIILFIPMVSFAISRNSQGRYYKFLYVYLLAGLFRSSCFPWSRRWPLSI